MKHPSYIVLAQSVADFQSKLADVLTLIMIFGFLYGTILIISGARQMRHGDYQSGKEAIISGVIIAAAPVIMRLLYSLFGSSGAL